MATSEHTLKIKAILDSSQVQSQIKSIQNGGIGDSTNTTLKLDQAITKLDATLNQLPNKVAQASSKSMDITSSKLLRMMGTYALGRIGSSASSYLDNSGYKRAGRVTGALSEMGQGTMMGAMAGGPPGAAIGLILSSVDIIFKQLGSSAKDAADALARLKPAIESQLLQESKYFDQKVTKSFISGAIERGDVDSLKQAIWVERNKSLNAQESIHAQDAKGGVVSQQGLKQRQEFFQQIQDSDALIAQYESAIAEIEKQKAKIAEEELKSFEEANRAAKERAKYETELNATISDKILDYERGEETESVRKMMSSGDFAQISRTRKEQGDLAKSQKEAYRDLLEQAANASTSEGKEFLLGQADIARGSWTQAQSLYDMLGGYKMPDWMSGFSAFNESQRSGYETLDFEGQDMIEDVVKDEVGKANKFLGDIKRLVNDIKNQNNGATFG